MVKQLYAKDLHHNTYNKLLTLSSQKGEGTMYLLDDGNKVFIKYLRGRIVGWGIADMQYDMGSSLSIFVDKAFRRQGFGTEIIKGIDKYLEKKQTNGELSPFKTYSHICKKMTRNCDRIYVR